MSVIATAFGSPHHPAWYHNLAAHPETRVTLNSVTRRCRARVALGDERRACWDLAVSFYPGYEPYLERARRPIPVLVLTPIE